MEHNNSPTLNRTQISSYIHDMSELESREFTLRKAAEKRRQYAEHSKNRCLQEEPNQEKL